MGDIHPILHLCLDQSRYGEICHNAPKNSTSPHLISKFRAKEMFQLVSSGFRTPAGSKTPTEGPSQRQRKRGCRRVVIHSRSSDHQNSWKKLVMLSDSFEVSTSTFDLCQPPAIAITRPDALLSSPTIQEHLRYFCRMHKQAERNANLRSRRRSTAASSTSESATAVQN